VIYPVKESDGSADKFLIVARDITKRKKAENALRETEERYRLVVERTSDLLSISTFSARPCYLYVSPSYRTVLGYKPEDLLGKSPFDFMHPEDRDRLAPVLGQYLDAKSRDFLFRGGKGPTERILYRLKDASGNWRLLEGTADLVEDKHILMVSRDVSVRAKNELDLERARKELERQVEERTRELKIKSETLEETNTALKVLLQMRERDRKELEQSVLFNVRQLAEPHLEQLRNSRLDQEQKEHVDILASSLEEILLPLSRDLMVNEPHLTAGEARIANLIKHGKSSKEISEIMKLSIKTVETHRHNIRAKLKLEKHKTNLRSYLLERSYP
jgi:PAS domain S-box-containing protein